MSYFTDTFPDEERKQWTEKCPSCGEEFLKHRGGAQCQYSCSALILQEEHERTLFSMVDYALPQYRIEVNCPKDWEIKKERMVGVSQPFATPPSLEIPWYTLRMKSTFFDTTVHELGHISSIQIKFNSSVRKALRKYIPIVEKYYQQKNLRNLNRMRKFERSKKYRNKVNYFLHTHNASESGHYEDAWQSEYERLHDELMNSAYSRYNYSSKPPYSYPKSIRWDWD